MAQLALSKSALQQARQSLHMYHRFLPSLDLKRRQLMTEQARAQDALSQEQTQEENLLSDVAHNIPMLANPNIDLEALVSIESYQLVEENVVGVKLPVLEKVNTRIRDYSIMAKPQWVDAVAERLVRILELKIRVQVSVERIQRLDKAIRRTTQRLNLFDKVLIPRARMHIKRIQIFLADNERAAVVRSKIAKGRHEQRAEHVGVVEGGSVSIALLSKVTFYGLMSDKEKVLEDLQDMGCIHVVPLGKNSGHAETAGLSQTTRNALTFLLSCPEKRHQILNPTNFHAASVEGRALEIKERIQPLQNERDFLLRRIGELCPWGYFTSPPPEVLGELKLWLYIVPHYQMKELQGSGVVWKEINRDNRFRYVVIVASQKPTSTPGEYVPMEDVSLSDLESRLEEVEVELEDLQAARVALTRWLTLFIRTVNQLENQEARANAAQQTFDSAPIFAVQGWTKLSNGQNLQSYAQRTGLALTVEEPGPEDEPPTLLENPEPVAGGQDLVSFYMMPSYRLWDPSSIVFFSFAVFFAMILSDAGYGALLGVILIGYWARMGHTETGCRMRRLFAVLVAASVVWGVLTGSFFGVSPPKGSILASLKLFDIQDATTMMIFSILIGTVHITIANLGTAWTHRGKRQAVASIGWTAIIVGGCALWLSSQDLVPEVFADVSPWIMGVGMFCVLLFSGSKSNLPWRLVDGVLALAGVTRAFGDVLSYLRLFALGLASASLALAFNDLAQQISESVAGFGTFLALLILLLGHGINLVLGIMSGVVHGLRLNYIEFFSWGYLKKERYFGLCQEGGYDVESLILILGWVGIYSPMALGAIGSMIGCTRAGQAAIGALLETESGHGRFIGVSAMPSSQTIYGIVVMLTLNRAVTEESSPGLFGIGLLVGLALMISAMAQGNCVAASINVTKSKVEVFGLTLAPAAVVEGFAVFAFVFALLLSAAIPA